MDFRLLLCGLILLALPASARADGDISIARGLQVSITGGCQDCHTAGYGEASGKVDPDKAMRGSSVGFRGPWGTTYPINLVFYIVPLTQNGFVDSLKHLQTLPPMPWYAVQAMDESDARSLYLYLKSLSPVGPIPPEDLAPGEEPTTPFIDMTPQMPKS